MGKRVPLVDVNTKSSEYFTKEEAELIIKTTVAKFYAHCNTWLSNPETQDTGWRTSATIPLSRRLALEFVKDSMRGFEDRAKICIAVLPTTTRNGPDAMLFIGGVL